MYLVQLCILYIRTYVHNYFNKQCIYVCKLNNTLVNVSCVTLILCQFLEINQTGLKMDIRSYMRFHSQFRTCFNYVCTYVCPYNLWQAP